MTYATQTDLVERFGEAEIRELTDRAGLNEIDPVVVTRALADATAEIDAHLATRYTLPITPVPPILVRIAADIARYRLWDDRASEEVRRRYDDAVRTLEKIAAGEVMLGQPAQPPPLGTGIAWRSPGRRFMLDDRAWP